MTIILSNIIVGGRVSAGIGDPPPVANFTSNLVTGTEPLSVTFTDTSTNAPTSWLWDFKNDGIDTSTLQNPTYVYTSAGTYTVKLTATNSHGSDDEIKTDLIVVVAAPSGSTSYTTPGTSTFTVPADVTSISAVLIGGGGGAQTRGTGIFGNGAGGGGLRYINNFAVSPGQTFTVSVGAGGVLGSNIAPPVATDGGSTSIMRISDSATIVSAGQGLKGGTAINSPGAGGTGTSTGAGPFGGTIGGGNGGRGGSASINVNIRAGGGGAAGYSGNGGNGGDQITTLAGGVGGNGTGGGAGGGGGSNLHAGPGGGVGILGTGGNGTGGGAANSPGVGQTGTGGSGGGNGVTWFPSPDATAGDAGIYGGGSGSTGSYSTGRCDGGSGAVRIIWGTGRSYPSNAT